MNKTDLVKASYIKYQGSTFYMAREDRRAYEQYKSLNPGQDLLGNWDEEILEDLFAKLWKYVQLTIMSGHIRNSENSN